MEGQLVQKTFTLGSTNFDCWVIKIGNKFWFKAYDIAVFLGYQNPDQAVRNLFPSEARKSWFELRRPPGIQGAFEPQEMPPNWQPHTVLISEGGLYRLLCKSTKPAAIKFERWVFDDLLPTLRETETYTIKQHLQFLTQQLTIKDQQLTAKDEQISTQQQQLVTKDQLITTLHEKVFKLHEKAAVMTKSDERKHMFQLYKHHTEPDKYIFIRTQSRYLPRALKAVGPDYGLILNEINVPNSMNILNRLKEKLSEEDIIYTASKNKLMVGIDILNMVHELLLEPQI